MAKFSISPDQKSRIVDSEEFANLPDGTLGKIIDKGDNYDGEIVINKGDYAVYSLSGESGWSDFTDTTFQVEVLPKGTVVTLTQE